jgi:hypothetical protein
LLEEHKFWADKSGSLDWNELGWDEEHVCSQLARIWTCIGLNFWIRTTFGHYQIKNKKMKMKKGKHVYFWIFYENNK